MTNVTNNQQDWIELLALSLSLTNGISSFNKDDLVLNPLSDSDRMFLENTMRDNITDESAYSEDLLNFFMDYLRKKEKIVVENGEK